MVEDEPLIAMDIEERLLAAGGTVIGPAANPETARRLIAETAPDAALLDANLAGSRVDDLAVELRRRRMPFAFATGFGRDVAAAGVPRRAGAGQALRSEELVAMVRALLAGRARRRRGRGRSSARRGRPSSGGKAPGETQSVAFGARSAVEKSR